MTDKALSSITFAGVVDTGDILYASRDGNSRGVRVGNSAAKDTGTFLSDTGTFLADTGPFLPQTAVTTFTRTVLDDTGATHARTSLGVSIGADVAAYDVINKPTVVDLTDGATPALNAALGTIFRLSAAGNRTIAIPTNPVAGQKIVIRHLASGGARTLALNTGVGGFRFGTDITALTETGSGLIDYIGCIYDATDNKWDVVAYAKGY